MSDKFRIDLRHFMSLTDSVGIISKAKYNIADRKSGYLTTDQSLAFLLSCRYYSVTHDVSILDYMDCFLAFLYDAFDDVQGAFRLEMTYDRVWIEGSYVSFQQHAQILWALGVGIALCREPSRLLCKSMFDHTISQLMHCYDPEACSFLILGIAAFSTPDTLAPDLRESLQQWILPVQADLGASTSVLNVWALAIGGHLLSNPTLITTALNHFKWIIESQLGSDEFFEFPYQDSPIQAGFMVSACVDMYRLTQDLFWKKMAEKAYQWFLGSNRYKTPFFDVRTGGCITSVSEGLLILDQHATQTLSWLIALCDLQSLLVKQDGFFAFPHITSYLSAVSEA